jgi:hypothetical protein
MQMCGLEGDLWMCEYADARIGRMMCGCADVRICRYADWKVICGCANMQMCGLEDDVRIGR